MSERLYVDFAASAIFIGGPAVAGRAAMIGRNCLCLDIPGLAVCGRYGVESTTFSGFPRLTGGRRPYPGPILPAETCGTAAEAFSAVRAIVAEYAPPTTATIANT